MFEIIALLILIAAIAAAHLITRRYYTKQIQKNQENFEELLVQEAVKSHEEGRKYGAEKERRLWQDKLPNLH